LALTGVGAVITGASFSYDDEIRERTKDNGRMPRHLSLLGTQLGSGAPGVALAVTQLYFDRENGLLHARALAFTSLNHITLALAARRERPNKKARIAFPSGHTSSSFATAGSLAYAYGWWAGVPAFAAAGLVAGSKWADNQHWFSDTVAGALIGLFWARASHQVLVQQSESSLSLRAVPLDQGAYLELAFNF